MALEVQASKAFFMGAGKVSKPLGIEAACLAWHALSHRRLLRGLSLMTSLVASSAACAQPTMNCWPSTASLSQLQVDAQRPTVIVVLSPRMPYSMMEWPRMRDAARGSGFEVRAYRDARVPVSEWLAAAAASGSPDLDALPALPSTYSVDHGLLNHAPASAVVWHGVVHPWPILGVMPTATWRHVLHERLNQLRSACS